MRIGVAQVDITPRAGGKLSGFAAREQPSTGVMDPLWAKAIYLANDATRLLWIHCDLIGFDSSIVAAFRDWASHHLGLASGQVMLSATHTHSGPATVPLCQAGDYDHAYVELLQQQLRLAAGRALYHSEECSLVTAEGDLDLAVDRRHQVSSHTDKRVAGAAFRRTDGTFAGAIINYAIHPVALGPNNRAISRDLLGFAADEVSRQLPGRPIVLATNGACGNLNPPAVDVSPEQAAAWGRQIADAIAPLLASALPLAHPGVWSATCICPLPLEVLDPPALDVYTAAAMRTGPVDHAWRTTYSRVVERWRASLLTEWRERRSVRQRNAELFAVGLGNMVFVGANAEIFSRFTDWLRRDTGQRVYTVGYANGNLGYLAPREAYAEGGYEVDSAHFFYGGYRFQAGALEELAHHAAAFVKQSIPPQ